MTDMRLYDVIVVGAGIEGSATAYSLAKRGRKTLLLEQFRIPHARGSSHGQSRITRKAYHADYFAQMMCHAYPMWSELERESGTELYRKTGVLVVSEHVNDFVAKTEDALKALNLPHQKFEGTQINKRFPMLNFTSKDHAIFEPEGGVLFADKALAAFQKMFVTYGGVLRDGDAVESIVPGHVVTVKTAAGVYRGESVVITAGPWTNKILRNLGVELPIKVLRIKVFYWKQRESYDYTPEKGYPCLVYVATAGHTNRAVFSLPAIEYPNLVKLCYHYGQEIDPDLRDADPGSYQTDEIVLKEFISKHMPGLESTPSITEVCMYSWTPDENFYLGLHPKHKNIVIGAGFAGHGFKLSPVVGTILADFATGKKPEFNVEPFKIDRFGPVTKANL